MLNQIKLNVGGQLFTTSKLTIETYPESFLAKLCDSQNLKSYTDENSAIFIDRDGNYFQSILDFYKYKRIILTENMTILGLYEEAKFYLLEKLIKKCEKQINLIKKFKKIKLNVRGEIFQTTVSVLTSESNYFKDIFDNLDLIDSYKDQDGIFIDRDPDLFFDLHQYMNNGSILMFMSKEKKKIYSQKLLEEAKYFRITSLVKKIESYLISE